MGTRKEGIADKSKKENPRDNKYMMILWHKIDNQLDNKIFLLYF